MATRKQVIQDEKDAEARARPQVTSAGYNGPERRVARADRRRAVDGYFVRLGGEKQRAEYAESLKVKEQ